MNKLIKAISYILVFAVTAGAFSAIQYTTAQAAAKDFRAVWVSTVVNLDYPTKATTSSSALKSQADKILTDIADMGMTAVILQVSPCSDAFYKSSVFPWSAYLTGSQTSAPDNNFDPLKYWVEKAHSLGLELHAWINPYRVAMNEDAYNSMAENNPAKLHPDWVVKHTDGKYYFNPGIPEVQQLIIGGVKEVVDNYDVDGIHMDDYFYPSEAFDDANTYAQYGSGFSSIGDWRRNNNDVLIQELKKIISAKPGVVFGISPSGIWANKSNLADGSDTNGHESYFSAFADTKKWVKNNWIDYICPQIYWYIGYGIADYEKLAYWWSDVVNGTNVKLYLGMADYQAGNSSASSPWHGITEIKKQINLNSTLANVSGEAHFRYSFLVSNKELNAYYKSLYKPSSNAAPPSASKTPLLNKVEHNAYMIGTDGMFRPSDKMTRAEVSVMLARLMVDSAGNTVYDASKKYNTGLSDVDNSAWYGSAVGLMKDCGIIKGYDDGTFRPSRSITRAEFATIVSAFGTMSSATTSRFKDANAHWSSKYVANAVEKGYITGYDDGTFKPDNELTRAEAVTIVNRMLGRSPDTKYIDANLKSLTSFKDVPKKFWGYYQILEATNTHYYKHEDKAEYWSDEPIVEDTDTDTESDFDPIAAQYSKNEEKYPYESDTFEFLRPTLKLNYEMSELDMKKLDSIALHHMDSSTAGFRDVEDWHLQRGWATIGYNFWIDKKGQIYVGRGWHLGAGVADENGHIISIGFQGDYENKDTKMPKAQYKAGVKLINWILKRISTIKYIGGHKDFGPTACPGQYFPLDEMVEEVGSEYKIN